MTNENASPLDPISGAEIEKQLVANGATAPRLTPDGIHAVITDESYCLLENTTTTICYLTLENGFVVTGESACISVENFDQKIGCEVAYKQALGKIWMLEGYLMKQRIYDAAQPRPVDLEHIARVAHEVNRAYCAALGDGSQLAWEDAPAWQRESARMGADLHVMGDFGPEASHVSWANQKIAEGWVYGEVKDAEAKTHPCLRPFDELPREQQAKDYLFRAVVHALKPAGGNDA